MAQKSSDMLRNAGLCCSPRKMAPLDMVIVDVDYNVRLERVPGMKVVRNLVTAFPHPLSPGPQLWLQINQ